MAILKKGDKAPEFKLKNNRGEEVDSSKIEGSYLLSFHPLAWTSVCTDQMRSLERNYGKFEDKGVKLYGVSVDPEPGKAMWAKVLCLDKLEILSDFNPIGDLAKACGIYKEDSQTSGRANILIKDGKVAWSKEYELSELPDIDEVLENI